MVKKIKWNCFTCNHIYEQKPDNKCRKNTGCPYCSNPSQKLCENIECEDCFNKTCASNKEYMQKWNDEKDPRQIFLLTDGGVSNTEGVIKLVE